MSNFELHQAMMALAVKIELLREQHPELSEDLDPTVHHLVESASALQSHPLK